MRDQKYEVYKNKKIVSLESVRKKPKYMQLFEGCRTFPQTLLDIVFKRIQFLKTYNKIKEELLHQFVYLDETWIFQNGTYGKRWNNYRLGLIVITFINNSSQAYSSSCWKY
ncbi:uncharacterized protein LOC143204922 [Rhynchophorus ferrugineus]|uniref:uncharacterized protein LOC143204922 n=1 Tax=Rhynchophorus ferrugineus TaxID=354439 RepID=UPI003FCE0C91